ncbi:hypothetical protein [Pinibacter aurantiacus]|uniref:Uncharacterized protein n=1 Tax=Pinibacter aurantiacus TaxID=2851599 RepID=A0A9E2SCI4_9BACT|nr:hypothetical protein [Pinibacter aurantiacus]MBV4358807.1 hypothetical protein [Pinibacter aurantiacus]
MNWKDFTIRAWRAGFRWVAFNVHHICTREAKCFKSAIDADQYCMTKNHYSTDWQFDHLGNIKSYVSDFHKNQIDWNNLCSKLSQFNIRAITKEQPLLSQLASGLYCAAAVRKPYVPLSAFKKFKLVTIHGSNSHEKIYDGYLEALRHLNNHSKVNAGRVAKFYGIRENASKEFTELLFSITNVQSSASTTSAFNSFCDPTMVTFLESAVFIRFKQEQNQLLFYDEFSSCCSWHKLPLHFNLENFYALKKNISKFSSYE